jgi:hypothetical protein
MPPCEATMMLLLRVQQSQQLTFRATSAAGKSLGRSGCYFILLLMSSFLVYDVVFRIVILVAVVARVPL